MKHLLLPLLLTSTAIQSMELTTLPNATIHNLDILSHITEQICWDEKILKRNIQALTVTDKKLYEYYTDEKTQQRIVRQVALYKNLSDSMVARHFGYTTIEDTIDSLFAKINLGLMPLTQKDLLDRWYLNSTRLCASLNEGEQETLLLHAIKSFNFIAAKELITADIDCNSTRTNNLFPLITNYYCYALTPDEEKISYDIIEFLLKKNYLPDNRVEETCFTLLHQAACKGHKQLAFLLLVYGANPYMACGNGNTFKGNAFDLEIGEPKGWLTTMFNEINDNKQKRG